jgi:hypothetical protein
MAKGAGKTEKQEQALSAQQLQLGQKYSDMADKSMSELTTLTAPQVTANTNLINAANSGDYSKLIQAAGPQVGTVSSGMEQARQQIINSVPAGAGRDAALAQIPIQASGAQASALNQAYTGALNSQTQIGSMFGGIGLQQAGAGISSTNAASSTLSNVAQQQNQGKASTMGFLGSLAGGAGSIVGGGFAGGKF